MNDADCVQFLQWALPRMLMRWPGFRKVRNQVCKRIARRIRELNLSGPQTYRQHLDDHPEEWRALDSLTRVSISRFYRDKRVFRMLEQEYLPYLAMQLQEQSHKQLRIWSVGCASGEEPYTLALLWTFALSAQFPDLSLHILATDADTVLLARARTACYAEGSVKNLPEAWRDSAFEYTNARYCLHRPFTRQVEFRQHDVRDGVPDGPFHLVLCRNLVFTYFEPELQRAFLNSLQRAMHPAGILLLGVHESLPEGGHGFTATSARLGFYEFQALPLGTSV